MKLPNVDIFYYIISKKHPKFMSKFIRIRKVLSSLWRITSSLKPHDYHTGAVPWDNPSASPQSRWAFHILPIDYWIKWTQGMRFNKINHCYCSTKDILKSNWYLCYCECVLVIHTMTTYTVESLALIPANVPAVVPRKVSSISV